MHVVAWHLTLRSLTEPEGAHLGIGLDDEVPWETRIPIPVEAQVFDIELPSPTALPADAWVTVHLHDHGIRTYKQAADPRGSAIG